MGHHFHSILGPGFDFEARIMETRPYIAIFTIFFSYRRTCILPSIGNLSEKTQRKNKYYPPLKRKGKKVWHTAFILKIYLWKIGKMTKLRRKFVFLPTEEQVMLPSIEKEGEESVRQEAA